MNGITNSQWYHQMQQRRKSSYFPHSGGGFHADKSIADLASFKQFLTTKNFVVN